jgi:hypothetical protein
VNNLGQKQKLFEDTANVMEWMNDENFREFVGEMVQSRPHLVARLTKEIARVERKQLTRQ